MSPFEFASYECHPLQQRKATITKAIDAIFAILLLLGALLHSYGTFVFYPAGSEMLVWSIPASLAAALIAVLNLLRRARPGDNVLALICLVASLAWVAIAFAFGAAIGNLLDVRVLWHAIAALALALFSAKALVVRAS